MFKLVNLSTQKKELVKNYKHKFLSKFLNFHFNRQILGYKIFKSRVIYLTFSTIFNKDIQN